MELYGLLSVLSWILIIIFILFVLIMILLAVQMSYNQAKVVIESGEVKRTIQEARKMRFAIVQEIIKTFNGYADPSLVKQVFQLMQQYPNIKNENTEIHWENQWITPMKYMMDAIEHNVSDDQYDYFMVAKDKLEENEAVLSNARQRFRKARLTMERMNKQPFAFILKVGNKISGIFGNFLSRQYDRMMQREQAQRQAIMEDEIRRRSEIEEAMLQTQQQMDTLRQMHSETFINVESDR